MTKIMTLEEVRSAKSTMWLWLETRGWIGGDIFEEVLRIEINDFSDYVTDFIDKEECEITCANNTYGIDWRCWTEQPSETEREAIKWK